MHTYEDQHHGDIKDADADEDEAQDEDRRDRKTGTTAGVIATT
jgi:hypothetical protein